MSTERSRRQSKDLTPSLMETTAASVGIVDGFDIRRPSASKKICHFSCKICYNLAKDPVLNAICGHLFCWSCLSKRGREKLCPFCGCHLDNSDAGLTIVPVYSGHPPSDPPIILKPGEESVKKAQGNREPDTHLRRAWYRNRRFASQSNCIAAMITRFKRERGEFQFVMNYLFECFPPPQEKISYTEEQLDGLIKDLQDGWRWLKGKKHESELGENVSIEIGELSEEEETTICWSKEERANSEIVLSPTISDFPIQLSYFSCEPCKDIAFEPVVTVCGHLYCWTCLYHQTTVKSPTCRVCKIFINIYPSRNNINPIYCESNEDDFLKCRRKNEYEKLPCRLPPTIAAPYLDYMIGRVVKLKDAIMTRLNDLEHNQASKDTVENITSWMEGQWDELFRDLLIKWRKDSGEQIPEKLINPTFLDFKYQKASPTETKEKAVRNLAPVIVDITNT